MSAPTPRSPPIVLAHRAVSGFLHVARTFNNAFDSPALISQLAPPHHLHIAPHVIFQRVSHDTAWTLPPSRSTAKNTYSTQQNVNECTNCESGKFQNQPGQTACQIASDLNCQPGSYVNGNTCSPCDSGFYSSFVNSATCTIHGNCPAGTYVTGQPSLTADRQCTNCAAGTFSTSINAGSCASWCVALKFRNGPSSFSSISPPRPIHKMFVPLAQAVRIRAALGKHPALRSPAALQANTLT
jgi:hypothetical protein